MADNGQKSKPPESPDLQPGKEKEPALKGKQDRAGVAIEVTEDKSQETVSNEKERLEREKTIALIDKIDPLKESKQQLEAVRKWETVSVAFLVRVFDKGVKKDELKDFAKFVSNTDKLGQKFSGSILDDTQKATVEKFKQVALLPDSALFKELTLEQKKSQEDILPWNQLVENAEKHYLKAKKTKDSVLDNKSSKDDSLFDWFKENPKTAAIGGIALIAGAYGLYSLFSDKKEEQESSEGSVGKTLLLVGGGAVLSAIALGSLAGPDKIIDLCKGIYDLSEEQIAKFKENWSKGEYLAAAKCLTPWGAAENLYGRAKAVISKETKLLSDAKNLGKEMAENVGEGYEWLNDKIHFGELKNKIISWFTEHNITPPIWIPGLKLSTIASDLNIKDSKSWEDFLKNAGYYSATGIGAAALLLYSWSDKKPEGVSGAIASGGSLLLSNAAVWLLLVREGRDSFGGKVLKGLSNDVDKTKSKILGDLNKNPLADLLIPDAFLDFKIENKLDLFLNWIEEHPAEAMVGVNALWFCKSIIVSAIAKIWEIAKDNPGKTALVGVLAGMAWQGRRELVVDIVNKLYPDDPEGPEAKKTLDTLCVYLDINLNKKEQLVEKQCASFVKSMVDAPLQTLNLASSQEAWEKGKFSFIVDSIGKVFFYYPQAFSVPVHLAKLSWKSLSTTFEHLISPEHKGGYLVPVVVAQTEAYIFGSMAFEGAKGFAAKAHAKEGTTALWKVLKSTFPGTAEWRYVWRSSLSGVPGVTKIFDAAHLGRMEDFEKGLARVAEIAKTGSPQAANDALLELKKMSNCELFKLAKKGEIAEKSLGTTAKLKDAEKVYEIYNDVKRTLGEAIKLSDPAKLADAIKFAEAHKISLPSNSAKLADAVKLAEAGVQESKALRLGSKFWKVMEGSSAIASALQKAKPVLAVGGKVLKVAGVACVYLDAALSVYEAGYQAYKLKELLDSEGVDSISDIPGAVKSMANRAEETEVGLRKIDIKQADEIVKEKDLDKKLIEARNFVVDLKVKLVDHGYSRREEKKDMGWFETVEDYGGAILSYPLTGNLMDAAFGSESNNLKAAEMGSLRNAGKQAKKILEDIEKLPLKNEEISATIESLEAVIELTKKTVKEDKAISADELKAIDDHLNKARAARKQSIDEGHRLEQGKLAA